MKKLPAKISQTTNKAIIDHKIGPGEYYNSRIDPAVWTSLLHLKKGDFSALFNCAHEFEIKLEQAARNQEYQAINDVEFALGWRPLAYTTQLLHTTCVSSEKFEKAIARSFGVQVGKKILPYADSKSDFLNLAYKKSALRTEKSKPDALIYIPFLPINEFWTCLQNLSHAWRLIPSSAKKTFYQDSIGENANLLTILNRIHLLFVLEQSEYKKMSAAVALQAIQNRNLGGLVGYIHRIVPMPAKKTALKLEISPDHTSLECEMLQNPPAIWPRIYDMANAQELQSACFIAATMSQCGGPFAGPEFLFSGKSNSEKLCQKFKFGDGKDQQDYYYKVSSDLRFFEKIINLSSPLSGPLLEIATNKFSHEERFPDNIYIDAKIKKFDCHLSTSVRWKTKEGTYASDLVTGLHQYLGLLLQNKPETILEPEETDEILKWELEPEFVFKWNGLEITESEFLQTELKESNKFVTLYNGDKADKSDYDGVLKLYLTRKRTFARMGEIGFHNLFKAGLLAGSFDNKGDSGNGDEFAALMDMHINESLKSDEKKAVDEMTEILHAKKPLSPNAELWHFQSRGVAWILSRFRLGLNACLADEMGLGKTITSICTIQLLRPKISAPILILAPKSLVTNWKSELNKFAPNLKVAEIEGDGFPSDAQVVICGYHRFRNWNLRKQNILPKISLLIMDEAHVLKNSDTKISDAVRNLGATFKLALTGTPLENHLGELWNLLDILNPGYLGGVTSFRRYAEQARKNVQNREKLLSPLREFLWAIMLRRTKVSPEVKLDLPGKIFSHEKINLSAEQAVAYRSVLEMSLDKSLLAKTTFGQRAIFLKAILHLKQICIHPDVFFTGKEDDFILSENESAEYAQVDNQIRAQCLKLIQSQQKKTSRKDLFEDLLERSEKFSRLFEILSTMKETESGILVFTQFRAAASLLQKALHLSGENQWQDVSIFHGSLTTAERDKTISEFRNQCSEHKSSPKTACPILILSLKAGGVGLNLTSASAVIHLDRWWNPAVEDQATDRAHRMGQSETVTVVTLTSKNTIEESLDDILNSKRSLAFDILGQGADNALADFVSSPEGFERLVDPGQIYCPKGKYK